MRLKSTRCGRACATPDRPGHDGSVRITAVPLRRLFLHTSDRQALKDIRAKPEQGDCGWADLPVICWPHRVRERCRTGASLAIAHALKPLYEEPPAKKWWSRKKGRGDDMTILQQSSKAHDRSLGEWYHDIAQGQIKLPRFQRFEAWDRGRIGSFLNAVVNNLPIGVTLTLAVAGEEKFASRFITTAEREGPSRVTQHLLDGQQRLTAFWRAMHNNYAWETYFIYVPEFDRHNEEPEAADVEVRCVPRWANWNGLKMPRWAGRPNNCLYRGLIPVHLLRPGDMASEINAWVTEAMAPDAPTGEEEDAFARLQEYNRYRSSVEAKIAALRERVAHFNLPYLSLPASTEKGVALQVFINMNTNSKPLSLYDIVVAEVESVSGESLHSRAASLAEKCPNAAHYDEVTDLILSTSALLQDQLPNNRGMIDMNKEVLLANWSKLERGLERMAALLASQGVFDQARLPTNVVLPVVAAAYDLVPDHGDFVAKAERLLRRYLWSSFLTDRYENSAASRAFADFKAIKALLQNPGFGEADLAGVPVLDRSEFPLPDVDSLMGAGWPRGRGIRARGVMAVTTYFGALDFADERPAAYENLFQREYHHVFPDALLQEAGIGSDLALNCALITWKTNRMIGRKDPLDYLMERVKLADLDSVRSRLRSHLISYDLLAQATYGGMTGDGLAAALRRDYTAFLRDRGARILAAASFLAEGLQPSLEAVWHTVPGGATAAADEAVA